MYSMPTHWWSQGSTVSIVTILWVGRSRVRVPPEARHFPLLHNIQISSRAHPVGTSGQGMQFSHLSRLRMNGAVSAHCVCLRQMDRENFTFLAPIPFSPWGNAFVKWFALGCWRRALYWMGFEAVAVVVLQNICVLCDVVLWHWTYSSPQFEGLYFHYLCGYGVCGA